MQPHQLQLRRCQQLLLHLTINLQFAPEWLSPQSILGEQQHHSTGQEIILIIWWALIRPDQGEQLQYQVCLQILPLPRKYQHSLL